jgi:hypothetical protein
MTMDPEYQAQLQRLEQVRRTSLRTGRDAGEGT